MKKVFKRLIFTSMGSSGDLVEARLSGVFGMERCGYGKG